MAGDAVVVTKSGKTPQGVDRFFSSLYGKAVPGWCLLRVSLMSVKRRTASPAMREHHATEPTKAPAEVGKQKSTGKRGRPQGRKNQHRREVTLRPSRWCVQETSRRLVQCIGDCVTGKALVFDGALG